ncbi:flagellar operon protein [Salinibacter ruber]|uniref:TIGR02530 family flagellar biosynthesis protein n=1 Tax=Salinibacter ruber TaxID=146919 RepID=UPI000E58F50C|nr:TIGR02530 family flagellar biosynthesis protein [Salinibacter ruber]MCS3698869.1 flagellar operon protein [Salinibacter ruber]
MTVHQRNGRVPPDALRQTPKQDPAAPDGPPEDTGESSFADHLEAAQDQTDGIDLSGHAKQRIAQRNISLDATQRQELADAMDQLDDKGAQDAAVLREDAAFVVNVPSRTVVTALDQTEMKQRVFTQIDSAMRL